MGKYLNRDYRSYEEALFRRVVSTIAAEVSIVQEVKFPDISFYQGKPNFDVMRTVAIAVIIRAGQRNWIDPEFYRNWSEARRVGLRRGVYWFYDDRADPLAQADLLISLIKDDLPEMEVVCDWENSYGGAYGGLANVIKFLSRVKAILPGVKLAIYTGYYWFKDHSNATANAAEYDYILSAGVILWLAWYTSNPAYVQVPAPWPFLTHWQFGTPAEGAKYGVQSVEIDMNYANMTVAQFEARYGSGGPGPVIGDTLIGEIGYFDGGTYAAYLANTIHGPVNYHTFTVEVPKIEFYVNPVRAARTYVPYMVKEYGLSFAVNGDGFLSVNPQGISASQGVIFPQLRYEETAWYNRDGTIALNQKPLDFWNALSFPNVLVEKGVKRPICALRIDLDPRTASGVSADGSVYVFMAVDGREYVGNGFNYDEVADRMIRFLGPGATIFMHDGGGSTTMAVMTASGPLVLNTPCGEETVGSLKMRPVANILGIRAKGGSTVAHRYNAVSSAYKMSLRKGHSTLFQTITSYPVNTIVYGDELFTAPTELINSSGVVYQFVGDVWLHVLEVNGAPVDGWMAIIHLGKPMMVLTDTGSQTWPAYLWLEDPSGSRQKYNKA